MIHHSKPDGLLSTNEVAHLLNIHMNTVRRWSDSGLIKSYRVGPRHDRRFREEDITRFIADCSVSFK